MRAAGVVGTAARNGRSAVATARFAAGFVQRRHVYGGTGGSKATGVSADAEDGTERRRNRPPLPVTVGSLRRQAMRPAAPALCMLTAYDAPGAAMAAKANVDMILVGDSLGMVVQGRSSTVRVSMEDIVSASTAVDRGLRRQLADDPTTRRPLVVGDMPFGSYLTVDNAVHNAARIVRDGRADAVKLEGGQRVAAQVQAIVAAGIPVIGHVGLTPQTSGKRYVAVGKTAAAALRLVEDAKALETAGCFAVVLECVPEEAAQAVTQRLRVPTIGIGAGRYTSGQVLVMHDVLGMYPTAPRFAKQFADVRSVSQRALTAFRDAVAAGRFPGAQFTPTRMAQTDFVEFSQMLSTGSHDDELERGGELIQARPAETGVPSCPQPNARIHNVLVVGGGAVGLGLAGRIALSAAHPRVQLLTRRRDLIAAVKERRGIRVSAGVGGLPQIAPLEAIDNIDFSLPIDLVILAHKAASKTECARAGEIASAVLLKHPECPVLTVQNGKWHEETFRADTDMRLRNNILAGFTTFGATGGAHEGEPDHVVIAGEGRTVVSPYEQANDDARVRAANVINFLQECGLAAEFADNWQVPLWNKLCVSSIINSLTALARVRNEQVGSDEALAGLADALASEVSAVACAHNVDLDTQTCGTISPIWTSVDDLSARVRDVCRQTASNSSSMLTDVISGRETEAKAIVGYMQQCARQLALDTPVLDTVTALLESIDRHPGGPGIRHSDKPDIVSEARSMQAWSRRCRLYAPTARIGFVPTMGALHEGHLDLIRRAKAECDVVCASIFVNPTQFAAHEDLGAYPRTMESDIEKLTAEGVDVVFTPRSDEFYGNNFISYVVPSGMTGSDIPADMIPEGKARPHFFQGVATVVAKLFNVVDADKAYFGQKDAQQCIVVRRLAEDLNFRTEVVVCPTRREVDGLAMSSRNVYLDVLQRQAAPGIYAALRSGAALTERASGEQVLAHEVKAATASLLKPIGVEIEYVSLADANTGRELADDTPVLGNGSACLSVAVNMPSTPDIANSRRVRLIDNIIV